MVYGPLINDLTKELVNEGVDSTLITIALAKTVDEAGLPKTGVTADVPALYEKLFDSKLMSVMKWLSTVEAHQIVANPDLSEVPEDLDLQVVAPLMFGYLLGLCTAYDQFYEKDGRPGS